MKKNLTFIALASLACMATPVPGISGTVGGTVAGLGEYESVKLLNGGGDPITIGKNGAFSFPKNSIAGSTYAVSVQTHTPGIVCSVTHGHGTVGLSPVTDVGVLCTVGTETILHSFNGTDGADPCAGLVMDSTGNLYGTTWGGRQAPAGFGGGTVFKMSTTGETTVLRVFGEHGASGPKAGLVIDRAGNLYGTTVWGGAKGGGTVFKISATGQETVLHSFGANPNPQYPLAGLIMDGAGNLYGTTGGGGANGFGTVFKISATGKKTVLHSFDPRPKEHHPYASPIMDSAGNLYGTTYDGGQYGGGTVYRISAAGQETILHSFGTGTDGSEPVAGLTMDRAGNLYGTTYKGGAKGGGTAFKISAAGQETILYSFDPGTDGSGPVAALIMDSAGNFYGTTRDGGAKGVGTVFKISAAGQETILYTFGEEEVDAEEQAEGIDTNARDPRAGVIMDKAGNLYGTTYSGGDYDGGTVFKISAAGQESILHSFNNGTEGFEPVGGLIMDGAGALYGTTYKGGTNGGGTVFKISANGQETVLHSFGTGTDGSGPVGGLIMDSVSNLYGSTYKGGATDDGTVFKINTAGNETVLHAFTAADGRSPKAGLVMDSAGNLYGTTYSGGQNGGGTVFKITATGKETVLRAFKASDGGYPKAGLVMDSVGNLYGTTFNGGESEFGQSGDGTVFEISATGREIVLHSFGKEPDRLGLEHVPSPVDGTHPDGGLIRDGSGNLFGTTYFGGGRNDGTVFKISAAGKETVLYVFGGMDGANPKGDLVMDANGNLYGTTFSGGAQNVGTVFRLNPGRKETVLNSFSDEVYKAISSGRNPVCDNSKVCDGANPYGGLVIDSSGNLYGTTRYAGAKGAGTVFKIN